ncbi:MAG: hypothetical protein WCW77_04420 [Patescibacteria group bacterium]|jgi:hypothetical protein
MDNAINNEIGNGESNLDIDAPLTLKNMAGYMTEFTDQVLLPAIKTIVKEEVKNETKDIREKMVTKEELKAELKDIREKMVTKEYVDKLVTKEDQITKLLKNNEAELSASLGARKRQEEKIDDHEARIKVLEGSRA